MTIRLEGEQVLCRFHTSNRVQVHAQPLYEWIAETANGLGMAGATVIKGIMGFLLDGPVLKLSPWSLSQEVPVVVEVVDAQERVHRLLEAVASEFRDGVITMERAHVLHYRTTKARSVAAVEFSDAEPLRGCVTMRLPDEGDLLRIFIGDSDVDEKSGKPVYEMLVRKAREMDMAGATVLRGVMGFGKHSRLHSAKLLELSTDLPLVVEIVDSEEKIQAFMTVVDAALVEGLVTLEKVQIIKYGTSEKSAAPGEGRPTF